MYTPKPKCSQVPRARNRERGAAMVVVIALLVGLLAGGVTVLYIQMQSTRSIGMVNSDRAALFCAEAGIPPAVAWLKNNPEAWKSVIAGTVPTGYPIVGDIDPVGDPHHGIPDFEAKFLDNDDEPEGTLNNVQSDVDGKMLLISRCIKYPNAPRYVMHLVEEQTDPGTSGCSYTNTGGQGCGNTNNANVPPPTP